MWETFFKFLLPFQKIVTFCYCILIKIMDFKMLWVFFCNQAGNFVTTSSCQSADWLALVLLNRLSDWVQFVRLHIIISLKANMFLPFRHQHSTQCVLDLEISHVSVNCQPRTKEIEIIHRLFLVIAMYTIKPVQAGPMNH